jgi:predicted alpha/beta-fold hydrolase
MAAVRRHRTVLDPAVTTNDSAPIVVPYVAPRWLVGGHAQTILPAFLKRPSVGFRRERVTTPDNDFWNFDWLARPAVEGNAPLVVLFHGLESGSDSHYATAIMAAVADLGWRGVIPHFRGCGGELNLLPRAYHSGDHEEIGSMLAAIRSRVSPDTPIHAAGISLGGSALLNWLGREGSGAARTIASAAAVSTPLDLTASGFDIDRGFNRIYSWRFLATLRPKALALARRFPGLIDEGRVRRIHTMYAFDDAVTAPLHGFAGTLDYWKRASSKPWLNEIALPTLVLNAQNDPFVPGISLPRPSEASRSVALEQPAQGGHVGFLVGPFPGRITWLPERLLQFFRRGW